MYTNDNDDRFCFSDGFDPAPGHVDGQCDFIFEFTNAGFHAWTEWIYPYVKVGMDDGNFNFADQAGDKNAMYVDPVWNSTAPLTDSAGTPTEPTTGGTLYPYGSYQPNMDVMPFSLFFGCSWAPYSSSPATTTEISKPANLIMLGQGYMYQPCEYGLDVGWGTSSCSTKDPVTGLQELDPNWAEKLPERRGMVYALVDGHAKFVVSGSNFYSIDKSTSVVTSEPFGPVAANWEDRAGVIGFAPRDGGNH